MNKYKMEETEIKLKVQNKINEQLEIDNSKLQAIND